MTSCTEINYIEDMEDLSEVLQDSEHENISFSDLPVQRESFFEVLLFTATCKFLTLLFSCSCYILK